MVAQSTSQNRPWLLLRRLLAASACALAAAGPAAPIDLGGGHTLVPRLTFTDPLGLTHTRLGHRYRGLRVWNSELVLHGRGPDRPALAGAAPGTALAATPSPALPMLDAGTPLAEPLDLDLTPSLPLDQAEESIRPDFGAAPLTFSGGERVVYPRFIDLPAGTPVQSPAGLDAGRIHRHLAGYALAYLIRAEAASADPVAGLWDYLVDAHSGKLLERVPVRLGLAAGTAAGAAPATPEAEAAPLPALAAAPVLGQGKSLYSGTVQLNTSAFASRFWILDTTRGQGGVFGGNAVTDMNHAAGDLTFAAANPTVYGALYANGTNDWGNGAAPGQLAPTSTPAGQTTAVDAAYSLQTTWDYFRKVHGRDGIDGAGGQTVVRVNYGGDQNLFDNAFWTNGAYVMTVQDGKRYWPLTHPIVMAHEFTHGVTEFSANLPYRGESGGLNEATSDIFGVMADLYTRQGSGGRIPDAGAAWIIPRYWYSPAGALNVLRYLIKPSKDGLSADAWKLNLGLLDVHYSSGPMNRAFYFLSQGASADPASDAYSAYLPGGMTGIGNDAAARIWYRALTTYLTPASNYKDARTAALRSARDLFPPDAGGNASKQTIAVRKAFGAINVGDPNAAVDDFGTPGISASVTPSGTSTPSGADLVLSATATADVTEVDYFVDQVLAAVAFTPPSFAVPDFDAAHLLANGGHVLTASAFTPSGNAGASLPVPFTLDNPVQQILRDPGFEGGGLTGWQGDTDLVVQTDFTGAAAHSGYRCARFDRSAGRQNLALAQQVDIPAGTSAILTLWTQTQGNPALGATDRLQILVQPAGGAPAALDTLSSGQAWADWVQRSYDLSAYQGQTATIRLLSDINQGTGTAFLVDDLTLACAAGAPQVQVRVSLDPAAFTAAPLTLGTFAGGGPAGPFHAQVTGSPGSAAVTWSVLEGAGSLGPGPAPVYQPPAAPGFYHLVARSQADPHASAQVSIQVKPPLSLVPPAAVLETGASLPFTAIAGPGITPVFSASGGTVAPAGPNQALYTAPTVPGSYRLAVRPADGSFAEVSAPITVVTPISVTIAPAALTMVPGSSCPLAATVTGSANTDVLWTIQEGAAGGSISGGAGDAPMVYTAPAAPGTYHVIATSVAIPARSAVLTITVQAGGIAINPAGAVILTGGTVAFQAFVTGDLPVTWSVPAGPAAGAIDGSGVYTAPAAAGSCTVLATAANGSLSASATVTVLSTNFSGDGRVYMNAADLAILADAWGGAAGTPGFNAAADLNRDGVVDDQDVALFFSRFGGLP